MAPVLRVLHVFRKIIPGLFELELELVQCQMAQKPLLQGEVGTRALRVLSVWFVCCFILKAPSCNFFI